MRGEVADRTRSPGNTGLADCEVAITGRLAAWSREEAVAAIEAAGGRYVHAPTESTALVVFGQDGPPLDEEGQPTRSLRAARLFAEAGFPVRIVPEEELLCLLGEDERRQELHRLYTSEQLGRILGVDRAQVRAWVRQGLLRPAKVVRRLCFFDFQEVACARRLTDLWRSGVGGAVIRRSLEQLGWLGDAGRALAQLESADGGLVIRLGDGLCAEPSGQLRLTFEDVAHEVGAEAPSGTVTPLRHPRVPPVPRVPTGESGRESAEAWFSSGVCCEEEGRLGEAVSAYRRARELGGSEPEVAFNLGNALYALEHHDEAARAFNEAVEVEGDFLEAWNNLGNALAALERNEEAIAAYERALAIAPTYADAHYNLAEVLALAGDPAGAMRHWRSYLSEDPKSSWADEVRQRIAAVEEALAGLSPS